MSRLLPILPILLLTTALSAAEKYSKDVASSKMGDADVRFLIDGVEGIHQAGVPGPLCVFGDQAAPVIAGKLGNTQAPILAAAKFKTGRVVAFGHGGYLSKDLLSRPDGENRLLKNILSWLSKNRKTARIAVVDNIGLAEMIRTMGYEVQALKNLTDPEATGKFQVLVIDAARLSEDQVDRIGRFVGNGGGILTASLGWGWLQVSGKTDLQTEHTGNLLLGPMGIVWADGYLGAPSKKEGENFFPVPENGVLRLMNVSEAFQALMDHEKNGKKLEKDEIAQALTTVENGIRSIPKKQSAVFKPLEPLLKRTVIPTSQKKINKETMITEVLAITLQTEEYLKKQGRGQFPKKGVPALPAAESFPGSVPETAKTIKKTVTVDTSISDWHSLGLYAAPGQTLTVRIPEELADPKGRRHLGIRIGCHSDGIWGNRDWSRFPEITLTVPLKTKETKLANPFGGLVYVTVPRGYDKGIVSVEIDGCIESPLYVHGKTDLEQWRKTIRNHPGPWGELGSDRVILSLPSQHLRDLDNPDEVMEFWNKVLDACADLCGRPDKRNRPERMVCDRQISAGYMHSGYPVMTHMDVEKTFVTLKDENAKGWGFFHEFGHNHQSGDWTFDGTVEVTVNLFTMYVFEKVCGMPKEKTRDTLTPEGRKKKRETHFAEGAPFEKWKSDPFLALVMYADIQDEFGWEPFRNVFREYLKLKNEERPKNDDEKRDQWMVRMSREINRNLGPYFDQWGVPVSEAAKDSIKDLPEWKPYS